MSYLHTKFNVIGSVVSEELRWQDFGTDGRTDGRSDCTPKPAFAFGDAGKKRARNLEQKILEAQKEKKEQLQKQRKKIREKSEEISIKEKQLNKKESKKQE